MSKAIAFFILSEVQNAARSLAFALAVGVAAGIPETGALTCFVVALLEEAELPFPLFGVAGAPIALEAMVIEAISAIEAARIFEIFFIVSG